MQLIASMHIWGNTRYSKLLLSANTAQSTEGNQVIKVNINIVSFFFDNKKFLFVHTINEYTNKLKALNSEGIKEKGNNK